MNPHPDFPRLATLIATEPSAVAQASADGALADWLYQRWYLTPDAEVATFDAMPPLDKLDNALCDIVDTLSPWSDGWIVLSVDAEGGCIAGKGEFRRQATPGRHAGRDRPGLPLMPGDRISLPDIMSWRDAETGQWAAQSIDPPSSNLVRLYVNVGPDRVGSVLHVIVEWLIVTRVQFRMKCPGSSHAFARADALVLYLDQADWIANRATAQDWADDIEPLTRPGRPALTLPLAPGVGFAEDPGDEQSFGQQRCARIAKAIEKLPAHAADMMAALGRAIVSEGISLHEPWRCRV